jgi:hypothetical protein
MAWENAALPGKPAGSEPEPQVAAKMVKLRILRDKVAGKYVRGLGYKWDPEKKDFRQMKGTEVLADLKEQSERRQRAGHR